MHSTTEILLQENVSAISQFRSTVPVYISLYGMGQDSNQIQTTQYIIEYRGYLPERWLDLTYLLFSLTLHFLSLSDSMIIDPVPEQLHNNN